MKLLKNKVFWLCVLIFIIGFSLGAYLFARTIARPIISLNNCQKSCFNTKEILGLLTSVGIQRFGNLIPNVVVETDKTIAIENPESPPGTHYLIIPKKDIKNIGEMTPDDEAYIADAFAVMQTIIQEKHLERYRVIVNGPGFQQVTYLHFHLITDDQNAGE